VVRALPDTDFAGFPSRNSLLSTALRLALPTAELSHESTGQDTRNKGEAEELIDLVLGSIMEIVFFRSGD